MKIKSPEQLVIGDVIPNWGADLVVKHTAPEPLGYDIPLSIRVEFESGRYANYPVGTAIRVVDKG
jgi:hypothetical protein